MRRGLDGIAGIEIADDFRVRRHRNAGDGADRIGDVTGRRLLHILLGADLLGHRRDRVAHVLVGGLVGTVLHRHVGQARAGLEDLHFPQPRLADRQIVGARRQEDAAPQQ